MGSIFNPLRHQLPAYSPLSLRGVAAGVGGLLRPGSDPVGALSELLREEYGALRVALVGSGTQALQIALALAAGSAAGRGSIGLPAYSCYDVASAALWLGRPVRFYDLNPVTLSPDPESVRDLLARGVRVVVVAPLFAVPVRWDELDPVLAAAEPVVVEDAAQGFGGSWEERPLGSKGHLSVLSFGRGKGWTSGSGGGALLVRDPELSDDDLEFASNSGRGRRAVKSVGSLAAAGAVWALARPEVYGVPRSVGPLGLGETRFRPPREAEALSTVAAAVALNAYPGARAHVEVRRRVAREYDGLLREHGRAESVDVPQVSRPGYLRYPLRLEGSMNGFLRPGRARRLGAERGYPKALPHLEKLAGLLDEEERGRRWPGAADLVDRLVTLPTHGRSRAKERRELVDLIS
jgi:perosamine synthetase